MGEITQALPDFFVSRAGAHPADVAMAAEVGGIIETQGHRVVLQQWDFANRNFMERMDAALGSGARVVAILTPQYLATDYCAAEWMHALHGDPLNRAGRLIVLRAAECEPRGLLRTIAYWDLVPLRGSDDLLNDVVKAAIMPDAERWHAGPAGTYWREARALLHEAIKPTPSFTGRDEHLQKIGDSLWSGGDDAVAAITQPAAVTGLGGIGKSTLAREYAWQNRDRYAGIWWLNAAGHGQAESWEGVEQGLVEVGDHYVRGLAQAEDRKQAAQVALGFLADGGFAKPWLLVFDNVDDPRVLDAWRPRGNAHVLVTSRISNWSLSVSPVEVDAWDLPEAVTFLARETARADLSETELADLAETLGRLPLALSHAAAYLRRRKAVTIEDYLGDLDRHMSELPKDAEYRSPVYATFRAAIRQAEQEAPGAAALISLAAFFAPDDIPEELFQQDTALYPDDLQAVVSQPARLAETLGVLDDLSLIDFEPETRVFSVHRMVQATARNALGPDCDSWVQGAVGIAFSAFPQPAQETWPQCARLVAHVRALNAYVPSDASTWKLGWLLDAAGEYTRDRGALTDALPLFHASLAIRERLVQTDPGNGDWWDDLANSHSDIGDVLVEQGNLLDALAAYRSSLAIRVRLAKADPGNANWQRNLSVLYNKIGGVFREQGTLPDALAVFDASLTIAERLAKTDPGNAVWQHDLAATYVRIGDVLQGQGNLPDALAAYTASLVISEDVTKINPGNTEWQRDLSVSHIKVGDVFVEQGNPTNALAAFRASLAIRESLAKADPGNVWWQRDLSISHCRIGDVLVEQDNLPDALAAYRVSLAIVERLVLIDPGNAGWQRDLAISNERVGGIRFEQDDPEARQAFERALGIYEALITRNPSDVLSQIFSVGPRLMLSCLDPENARRHLEAALAILRPLAETNRLDAIGLRQLEQIEKDLSEL